VVTEYRGDIEDSIHLPASLQAPAGHRIQLGHIQVGGFHPNGPISTIRPFHKRRTGLNLFRRGRGSIPVEAKALPLNQRLRPTSPSRLVGRLIVFALCSGVRFRPILLKKSASGRTAF
ncbi:MULTISPECIES: hypothetical protein, partial [unclassified Pseudomonas]|uniref:hypothetical protein n=1 Tax=unclassified Pseudomonas TaxID=196821 RepID=UPI00244A43F4